VNGRADRGAHATRRQHYLPVCYLKGFCSRRKKKHWLVEWDLETETSRPSDPRNVAWQKDLYQLPSARSNQLEQVLGQIEGRACRVIDLISTDQKAPGGEDRQSLLLFVALLIVRVPAIRDAIDRFHVELAHRRLRLRTRSREAWQRSLEEFRQAGTDPPAESYDEMRRLVEKDTLPIRTNPEWLTHLTFDSVMQIIPFLHGRKWSLFYATEEEFVTCDNPVSVDWTRIKEHSFYPAALGKLGTDVYVPLTQTASILGRFEGAEGTAEVGRDQVAALNSRTLSKAFRYAYSSGPSFAWLKSNMEIGTAQELLRDPRRPQRKGTGRRRRL